MIESVKKHLNAFIRLGKFFTSLGENKFDKDDRLHKIFFRSFNELISQTRNFNGWFTEENIRFALLALGNALKEGKIQKWVQLYSPALNKAVQSAPKRIGVIMPGNIPLAGFHDFFCVLMSGNIFLGKPSSKDEKLLQAVADVLIEIEPEFKRQIEFKADNLKGMQAIIATGSDNSARYFNYYFGKYPNIIRKNRNSAAVLTGEERQENIKQLAIDIFTYFGLGCRSISKLYVPGKYNFDFFLNTISDFNPFIHHKKYGNNYDYHKAIFQMNKIPFYDNGFLLVKEDESLTSPVSVLHFERYSRMETLIPKLAKSSSRLQCIAVAEQTKKILYKYKSASSLPLVIFGETQTPELWDYADGADTMEFLLGQAQRIKTFL